MNIAMLNSGGVDSTYAMYLLKELGYNITAFYLKIWLEDEWELMSETNSCPWKEDLDFVEKSCKFLGVPFEIIPLQQEYQNSIISYMISQVKLGFTPNPDLLCNQHIKFGAFIENLEKKKISFDKVATGHYATTIRKNGIYKLLSSIDETKDQSYFLSHLNQTQLSKTLFPLGEKEITKKKVRENSLNLSLPTASRPDSQGLCFLGKINFKTFLERYLGTKTGKLVCKDTGKIMGTHNGFWFYTIGQRQGLGLGNGPWYVCSKDTQSNTIYISKNYFSKEKKRNSLVVHQLHFIEDNDDIKNNITKLINNENIEVKLRHGTLKYKCNIEKFSEDTLFIKINKHDQGIAPGQFAVFYSGRECLGCGVIKS